MGKSKKLTVSSNRYFPEHDVFDDKPYAHISTSIEIDLKKPAIEIDFFKEKDELRDRYITKSYVFVEVSEEDLCEFLEFLSSPKPRQEGETERFSTQVDSGLCRSVRGNGEKEEISLDRLECGALYNRINVETFGGSNPIIPFYENEQGNEPVDRENLATIQDFSNRLLKSLHDTKNTVNTDPIPPQIEKKLSKAEYGKEVLDHISDGDECLNQELLHPAMTSYIHAIEWTIISYLISAEGIDVIEQEKNGQLYSFAKGRNSLLDELMDNTTIDQKTISRIEGMNRAERRWAAHHKSGDVLQKEVEAVKSRLLTLLEQLFT